MLRFKWACGPKWPFGPKSGNWGQALRAQVKSLRFKWACGPKWPFGPKLSRCAPRSAAVGDRPQRRRRRSVRRRGMSGKAARSVSAASAHRQASVLPLRLRRVLGRPGRVWRDRRLCRGVRRGKCRGWGQAPEEEAGKRRENSDGWQKAPLPFRLGLRAVQPRLRHFSCVNV